MNQIMSKNNITIIIINIMIPAVRLEPSYILDVSRNGLSVPLTSWWSRLMTIQSYTKSK